ncbi:MAG TPA: hypothetical protein VF610_00705 [Segetibacter sp.]|jgi:hypothetical protein
MQNHTTEELIQYLYNETSEDKSLAIESALENDYSLKEKFDALQDSKQSLHTIILSPRPQSVTAILNYARNLMEVEEA